MRYPFKPNQFLDYSEYEVHSNHLDRAQCLAHKICGLWGDEYGLAEPNTSWQRKLFEIVDMAVQIGYEQAINKPHNAVDYGIVESLVEDLPDKCDYCKAQYFKYGCEERCALAEKDEACRLSVKERLE
jgi:hypothetical protein